MKSRGEYKGLYPSLLASKYNNSEYYFFGNSNLNVYTSAKFQGIDWSSIGFGISLTWVTLAHKQCLYDLFMTIIFYILFHKKIPGHVSLVQSNGRFQYCGTHYIEQTRTHNTNMKTDKWQKPNNGLVFWFLITSFKK